MKQETRDKRPETRDPSQAPTRRGWSSLVSGPWSLVLASALALALRKPWALHTPQLYAEDGSIFLVQDEQLGVSAFWTPYNGYLHLLPRLIAWLASHTADVAWWPAIYNGLAFAITVALFARFFSPRVELPAAVKPWLMLALPLVVGTGEVLINVTNLQWVTAFFLILQLFTAPATTRTQLLGDLALLLLVGLNGPFAIVLLPLFFARWLLALKTQNQHPASQPQTPNPKLQTAALCAAVLLCAATQAVCFFRTNAALHIEHGDVPFRPLMALSILGSRLVTWPLFGPAAVRALPIWLHAALAVLVIVPLLVYSLRRDAHRRPRAFIAATFILITLACAVRARADTWPDDNLVNGDRYFYISRVLLAWLLIFQFHAASRRVAFTARALAVLAILTHLPHFTLPTPPDYDWPKNCAPIRLGIPANIPTLPEGWWIEYPGRTK